MGMLHHLRDSPEGPASSLVQSCVAPRDASMTVPRRGCSLQLLSFYCESRLGADFLQTSPSVLVYRKHRRSKPVTPRPRATLLTLFSIP